MTHASPTLMDRLSVLIAGDSPVEVSLSPAEAVTAGCFIEDALSADDAADSVLSGEASHG